MSAATRAGVPASASTAVMVLAVLLVPAPTISCASCSAQTRAQVSITARCSASVERGRLSGGAERDDAGASRVEVLVAQALDRVEGDRAVGRERSDERDVDALEQSTSVLGRGGHEREGTARASSRARAKTASSIGGVSRPVNVFCCEGW